MGYTYSKDSWVWYELKKNSEVMVEVDVFVIAWRSLLYVRGKKDLVTPETKNVPNV
jgi:hypothetical protein